MFNCENFLYKISGFDFWGDGYLEIVTDYTQQNSSTMSK